MAGYTNPHQILWFECSGCFAQEDNSKNDAVKNGVSLGRAALVHVGHLQISGRDRLLQEWPGVLWHSFEWGN